MLPRSVPSATRHMRSRLLLLPALAAGVVLLIPPARAIGQPIIAIGDAPRVNGLRINFRDRRLVEVNGVNLTIWSPYRPAIGTVTGLALGLPRTGAAEITGLGIGVLGVEAEDRFRGIGIGGLGVGAGGTAEGIMLGTIGVGSGGSVRGIAIGGIGVGSGGDIRGAMIGGIGAGAGGRAEGLLIGGIGAGAGGNVRGIAIGGVGVGGGGNVTGISIGGVGVGAGGRIRGLSIGGVGVGAGNGVAGITIAGVGAGGGGDVTGLTIAGVGVGSGGTIKWVTIAGLGIGAPRIEGLAIAPAVGGHEVHAAAIAPGLLRVVNDGTQRGVALSAVSYIQGTQRGLTIGVVNYTWTLDGVQIGVINIARNNPRGRRVLPVINW